MQCCACWGLASLTSAVPNCPSSLRQALASRIQAKRLSVGQVQRILHARVPILKFRDVSGARWACSCVRACWCPCPMPPLAGPRG